MSWRLDHVQLSFRGGSRGGKTMFRESQWDDETKETESDLGVKLKDEFAGKLDERTEYRPITQSEFVVKESGERKQYSSGSLRDVDTSKVDYSRAFDGPMFERLAIHLTKANERYPDFAPGVPNWTLISTEEELIRYKKSAFRHFIQWYKGEMDEDHAAAVMFNINGVELIKEKLKAGGDNE